MGNKFGMTNFGTKCYNNQFENVYRRMFMGTIGSVSFLFFFILEVQKKQKICSFDFFQHRFLAQDGRNDTKVSVSLTYDFLVRYLFATSGLRPFRLTLNQSTESLQVSSPFKFQP